MASTYPAAAIRSPKAPIRIVPLRVDERLTVPAPAAPPGLAPQLTYRGGPLLTAVQVFTFFWGDAWRAQPQADLAQQINQFFDFILASALIDQMGEYSVPGKTIGQGARVGTATLAMRAPGS